MIMCDSRFTILEERFRAYTDRFRRDGVLHPMHQLKLEHTVRVAADARTIAEGLHWDNRDVRLAEAVGLFHDIARFPQFETYRTFADGESVDHGDLGAETLEAEGLLEGLDEESQALIRHAVQYHNKKELPRVLTAQEEKHLRLIRDADRLDIFFICWDVVHSGHAFDHPEVMMGVELDGPPSEAILEQFDRGETVDYRELKSMADRFVLQMSWMHDLSYRPSRRMVLERDILEKFMEVLPVKTSRLIACFERTEAFLQEDVSGPDIEPGQ